MTLVVLTGATRGIGRAAAIELAKQGADVALVGREPDRVEAVADEVEAAAGGAKVHQHVADLTLMSAVRALADEIRESYERIDVLANNAGALFASRKETDEGLEQTFALNHLASFLLTNLLTDIPEITIATDSVDSEMLAKPRRWNVAFIRNFMVTFGLLSSIFDYLTFGVLLLILHAHQDQFRTGWFLESVISASLIVLVIRSRRPFFRSKPSRQLLTATLVIVTLTLIVPYTPLATIFGFQPLNLLFLVLMGLIVILYITSAEIAKRIFYKMVNF